MITPTEQIKLEKVQTRINLRNLRFHAANYKSMLLLAVGDADGYVNIYSLVNGSLLQRLLITSDVAIMQVVFTDDSIVCGLENGTVAVVALESTY